MKWDMYRISIRNIHMKDRLLNLLLLAALFGTLLGVPLFIHWRVF